MSIDRTVGLGIGFVLKREAVIKKFRKKVAGKSHMEERFDAKTGKRLKDEEVVDVEPHHVHVLDGQTYGDGDPDYDDGGTDLLDAIADKVGCDVEEFDGPDDHNENVIFKAKVKLSDDEFDGDGLIVTGSAGFKDVARLGPELKRIKAELMKLGVRTGAARVQLVFTIN